MANGRDVVAPNGGERPGPTRHSPAVDPADHHDLVWTPGGPGLETARPAGGGLLVRATGAVDGPVLLYTPAEVEAFVRGVRDGEFDDLARPDDGGS